jgi:hypothetical protein
MTKSAGDTREHLCEPISPIASFAVGSGNPSESVLEGRRSEFLNLGNFD